MTLLKTDGNGGFNLTPQALVSFLVLVGSMLLATFSAGGAWNEAALSRAEMLELRGYLRGHVETAGHATAVVRIENNALSIATLRAEVTQLEDRINSR